MTKSKSIILNMKINRSILKIAACIFAFLYVGLSLYGCSKEPLIGNIFYYYDDSSKLIAAFEKDTFYYVLRQKSPVSPQEIAIGHKTKYSITKNPDNTILVTLEKKPTFWEKNTWLIDLKDDNTLYSVESGKTYIRTDDKSLLKK